jgi:hypothetical protein
VLRLGWFFGVHCFRVYFATDYGRIAPLLDECHKHVGGIVSITFRDFSASSAATTTTASTPAAAFFGICPPDPAAAPAKSPTHAAISLRQLSAYPEDSDPEYS